MIKDPIDRLIKANLDGSAPQTEIDVRRETMDRIKNFESKKEKKLSFFQSVLTFCTAIVSLGSIVFAETLFSRLRVFLILNRINPLTLKLIYQGFFAGILIGIFAVVISTAGTREERASVS
jgi:hypothetical protein